MTKEKAFRHLLILTMAVFLPLSYLHKNSEGASIPETSDTLALPDPQRNSTISVEEAILNRKSVRNYKNEPISIKEISQILWSAQGITHSGKLRSAPSAGATYPLEVYVVVGNASDLSPGLYHYFPQGHRLSKILAGDLREKLSVACLNQPSVEKGAIDLVFCAVYSRTTSRYGNRGTMYVHMEVGHASENVSLQTVSLGLGTVVIGAFDDKKVKELLGLSEEEEALYIMPIGRI